MRAVPIGGGKLTDSEDDRGELPKSAVERLAAHVEALNIGAYADLYRRPWRMLWLNFAAGLARGLGMAIGFALLGAVIIYLLRLSFLHNLPVIGKIIAQIVRIVQRETGVIGR